MDPHAYPPDDGRHPFVPYRPEAPDDDEIVHVPVKEDLHDGPAQDVAAARSQEHPGRHVRLVHDVVLVDVEDGHPDEIDHEASVGAEARRVVDRGWLGAHRCWRVVGRVHGLMVARSALPRASSS